MPYPGHLLEESYISVVMQLVYSTTPSNWANSMIERDQVKKYYPNLRYNF